MKHSIEFIVDPVNKILICEVLGQTSNIVDIEHMIKMAVKTAGKNSIKNLVLDITEFKLLCSSADIVKLMITVQESGLLDGLKIARITRFESNIQNIVEGLAEKLTLSIKNFETRSEAMLWLLFDKERENC